MNIENGCEITHMEKIDYKKPLNIPIKNNNNNRVRWDNSKFYNPKLNVHSFGGSPYF